MKAEIVATGEEIVTGALVDSNSAWLAARLLPLGIQVVRHHGVGDDLAELVRVFREVSARADIALVTGGLGPTVDDLSAEAAAAAAGVGRTMDERALESITAFFAARSRPMPPRNRRQALIPDGGDPLYNPVGTAPGFEMKMGRCRFFFLPGVPPEMRRMFRDQVRPKLIARQAPSHSIFQSRTIVTFGMPESAVDEKLSEFPQRFPGIQLGLRAHFPEIQVKLYLRGQDPETLGVQLDVACRWICGSLGACVVSDAGLSMAEAVGRMLRDRSETVAVAESCTGGLIATQLTDVAGSSDYFLLSAVTYDNAAKVRVLGVSEETIQRFGAVSPETAAEMASGVRRISGATYGISTSGIAGPSGGSEEKPVGTVCIGLAMPDGVESFRYTFHIPSRIMNKQIFAMKALDTLRRAVMPPWERSQALPG